MGIGGGGGLEGVNGEGGGGSKETNVIIKIFLKTNKKPTDCVWCDGISVVS